MLVFPFAVDLDVLVFISPSEPSRLLPFGKSNRLEDVPPSFGLIASDLNTGFITMCMAKESAAGAVLTKNSRIALRP
jgi:hypothetical protein